MKVTLVYLRQIAKKLLKDLELIKIAEVIQKGKISDFHFNGKGVMRYGNRLCVPNDI